jgi:hypothetical protein
MIRVILSDLPSEALAQEGARDLLFAFSGSHGTRFVPWDFERRAKAHGTGSVSWLPAS